MTKLVIVGNPTEPFFNLYIFEEDKKVETIETNINNIQDIFQRLMKKYNIVEINIAGSHSYMSGIAHLIEGSDCFHYSSHRAIIKYI